MTEELPILFCESKEDWDIWLNQNGLISKGVRLQIYKKQSGVRSITYAEAKLNGQWEKANAFFQALDATNRYAILFRLGKVSKPEKRLEKIQSFIQMLAKGEKFYN